MLLESNWTHRNPLPYLFISVQVTKGPQRTKKHKSLIRKNNIVLHNFFSSFYFFCNCVYVRSLNYIQKDLMRYFLEKLPLDVLNYAAVNHKLNVCAFKSFFFHHKLTKIQKSDILGNKKKKSVELHLHKRNCKSRQKESFIQAAAFRLCPWSPTTIIFRCTVKGAFPEVFQSQWCCF